MTLASDIALSINADGQPFVPISLASKWHEIVASGGMDAADNEGNTVTTPSSQITAAENRVFTRKNSRAGTQFLFSMFYTTAPTTAPAINVFGRFNSDDPWMPLLSLGGNRDITFTAASDDAVTDGVAMTTVVKANHIVDCLGCEEFLVGIKTAAADGGAATCGLRVKVI